MTKTHLLAAACLVFSALFLLWGFSASPEPPVSSSPRYVLLLTTDGGTDVLQLKMGAQTAADSLGAQLLVHTIIPEEQSDAPLLTWLDSLADLSPDGLILPPVSQVVFDSALATTKTLNIPLLQLYTQQLQARANLIMDTAQQAQLLIAALPDRETEPVYLLQDETPDAQQQQLLGILEMQLGNRAISLPTALEQFDSRLTDLPTGSLVLCTSAQLATNLTTTQHVIFSVAPETGTAALLENNIISGFVMQSPYAQGYQAVSGLHNLSDNTNTREIILAQSQLITAANMYHTQNIKIVFPLLH